MHNPKRAHWLTIDGVQFWVEAHLPTCECDECLTFEGETFSDRDIAISRRFSSSFVCHIMQLPSGNVALFDWNRDVLWIGPWAELPAAFANRPRYEPKAKAEKPASLAGIDLSSLDIQL